MLHQTIQQSMEKIKYLFVLSGMKLHETRAPEKTPFIYRAFFIFNFIWFNTDCLATLSYLCIGLVTGKSFTELSFIAPCITFSVLGDAKAITYTMNDREAFQLVEDLIKIDASRKTCSFSERVDEIKATETNFLRRVLNVLNVFYISLFVLYDIGPLAATGVTYFRTGEIKLFLPVLDVYPYIDALSLQYWPYAYFHQIWSVALVVFYVGSVDCFLLIICTYIRIQFKFVQLDFENIILDKNITSGQIQSDDEFQNKFSEIVARHREIIRLSSSLRKIYSKSILINVVTSSIIICLTGFNVTVIEELTMVLPSLVFLMTSLTQVLCMCYFGDLLMMSSEEVSGAVYASRWYLADTKIAKDLLFVLTRAQTPSVLTASGFMEVNLRAFMKILSTSWSYFALLNTIYGE